METNIETNADTDAGQTQKPVVRIPVFLDSGMQKTFIPLSAPDSALPRDAPPSLRAAVEKVESFQEAGAIPEATRDLVDQAAESDRDPYKALMPSVRWRFGRRTWTMPNGMKRHVNGIWLLVETNTSGADRNEDGLTRYDRGYFYRRRDLTPDEIRNVIDSYFRNATLVHSDTPFLDAREGTTVPLRFPLPFESSIAFMLTVKRPSADEMDVDLILDLGNSRTAGLVFQHNAGANFAIDDFRQRFTTLRLQPDPDSGNADDPAATGDGIASSWFVLHELDQQTYVSPNQPAPEPENLLTSLEITKQPEIRVVRKFPRKEVVDPPEGTGVERIPQMFCTLSPVVIGERASDLFNFAYAKRMAEVGAVFQQSSPKRYYWDDIPRTADWNMLLNKHDPEYDPEPADAAFLPGLQGEVLRFMRHDSSLFDLGAEDASCRPPACPKEPRYPRQASLTWFLLHVIERAYAQMLKPDNSGTNFTPRRFRRVLMTYPSGWSQAEVNLYRKRCQEALDIFSETHAYRGVHGPDRLELVPLAQSPDEAVAGQLPFLFSEIVRYPGLVANDFFAIAGKKRGERSTMRVMNIDIGGGTTDISIVEYWDRSAGGGVAYSDIAARLLFKDGQALAGDDLLKDVIERFVLGSLVAAPQVGNGGVPAEAVREKFTTPARTPADTARRSRVVRTCLIPLGLHCMGLADTPSARFSSVDAGVNQNNWAEFVEYLGADKKAMPRDYPFFSFGSAAFDGIIEDRFGPLFRSCQFYAAAYDADLVVFSGKTSELPHFRTMAGRILPVDASRIVFARSYKPGAWYPFTDASGCIEDAKTVTTVGAALYYALAGGFIRGWRISAEEGVGADRNDWGELLTMRTRKRVFLPKDEDTTEDPVPLPLNCTIARRRTARSAPEPVYRFIGPEDAENRIYKVRFARLPHKEPDGVKILSIDGRPPEQCPGFELKPWPCDDAGAFWQDTGLFDLTSVAAPEPGATPDNTETDNDEEDWA